MSLTLYQLSHPVHTPLHHKGRTLRALTVVLVGEAVQLFREELQHFLHQVLADDLGHLQLWKETLAIAETLAKAEKDKTERVTGLGRRTREEI